MRKKLNTVASQYKNPDKLINRLQNDIRWRINLIENCDGQILELKEEVSKLTTAKTGEHWFDYKDKATITVNLTTDDAIRTLKRFNVGASVVCFGHVTEITQNLTTEKYTAVMDIKTVHTVIK